MRSSGSILLLVLSVVLLEGCSGGPEGYDRISNLASAVDSAGVACDRIEPGPEARLVSESGTCEGSGVTLFLFESQQELEDWSKVGTRLGPTLMGSAWAVTGEMSDLEIISSETGGDVVGTDP